MRSAAVGLFRRFDPKQAFELGARSAAITASRLSTILARILGRGRRNRPSGSVEGARANVIPPPTRIGPSIVARQTSGVNVLVVTGELYRGEACDALREQVKRLLSHGEKERIVLNVENVSRIDNSGLGTLVKVYTDARDRGVDLKLVCPAGEVLRVLQITKLATIFQVFATDAEALASFE